MKLDSVDRQVFVTAGLDTATRRTSEKSHAFGEFANFLVMGRKGPESIGQAFEKRSALENFDLGPPELAPSGGAKMISAAERAIQRLVTVTNTENRFSQGSGFSNEFVEVRDPGTVFEAARAGPRNDHSVETSDRVRKVGVRSAADEGGTMRRSCDVTF